MVPFAELANRLSLTPRGLQHLVNLCIIYLATGTRKLGRGRERRFTHDEVMWAFVAKSLNSGRRSLEEVRLIVDALRKNATTGAHSEQSRSWLESALRSEQAIIAVVSESGSEVDCTILRLPLVTEEESHFNISHSKFLNDKDKLAHTAVSIIALLQSAQESEVFFLNSILASADEFLANQGGGTKSEGTSR